MSLTFYYGSGSPYAWKVWLALEHKAVPYEFRLLSFDGGDTKAPAFLAVNPRGRVPVIVDDGFALWESAAIVEYLEERYAQNPLLPKDPKTRAVARRLAAEADSYLAPLMGRLADIALYSETPVGAGEIDKVKSEILAELALWERQMTGPYFLGALSLADFAIFPHLRLLRRIEDRKPGSGLPNDRLPAKLGAWIKQVEGLPYYEKTMPPHWKG
jgi:glutathione S-transferase